MIQGCWWNHSSSAIVLGWFGVCSRSCARKACRFEMGHRTDSGKSARSSLKLLPSRILGATLWASLSAGGLVCARICRLPEDLQFIVTGPNVSKLLRQLSPMRDLRNKAASRSTEDCNKKFASSMPCERFCWRDKPDPRNLLPSTDAVQHTESPQPPRLRSVFCTSRSLGLLGGTRTFQEFRLRLRAKRVPSMRCRRCRRPSSRQGE